MCAECFVLQVPQGSSTPSAGRATSVSAKPPWRASGSVPAPKKEAARRSSKGKGKGHLVTEVWVISGLWPVEVLKILEMQRHQNQNLHTENIHSLCLCSLQAPQIPKLSQPFQHAKKRMLFICAWTAAGKDPQKALRFIQGLPPKADLDEHEKALLNEVLQTSPGVSWDTIAGLEEVKRCLERCKGEGIANTDRAW